MSSQTKTVKLSPGDIAGFRIGEVYGVLLSVVLPTHEL
jgi:hypothetical protein